jgi:C-terminal processing protease CtpA/Prc
MKYSLVLILLSCLQLSDLSAQKYKDSKIRELQKFTTEINKYLKKYSIVKDSIDWESLNSSLDTLTLSENLELNKKKIIKVYTTSLRKAGDIHTFFMTSNQIKEYEAKNTKIEFSEAKYLEQNIGYINVPAFSSYSLKNEKDFANTIRNQIEELDTQNTIKYWVVDLRNNTGGNMWPMIAGLNALFKDGIVGSFISTVSEDNIEWKIKNGIVNYSKLKINSYKIKNLNVKIAILLNENTASSGEMTAISMIGLTNTKTFGQKTAGYTTVNSTIKLKDKTEIYLATGYCTDRNNKVYNNNLIPDKIVEKKDSDVKDSTLDEARKWLLEN